MDNDLKAVFDMITAKRHHYDALDDYYNGNQPTVYLTRRLREIFRELDIAFTENWCAVVIDACNERINLTGFESSDARAEAILNAAWERNQIALEASDTHLDAQVIGECFVNVWPGLDGKAELFYNDPRLVCCMHSEANPRQMTMTGKLWCGADGKAKMTLYYADHLEYYTSVNKYDEVSDAAAFQLDTSVFPNGMADNPYGRVPWFHFKINRRCASDLANVIPLQNGTNKLLADMMVAAEFGAYNQRWVISSGDSSGLKNAPGEVWDLPAGDGQGQGTQVGQFQSTDLKNYLDAIDRLSMAIGIITRTPRHYFYSQGGDPSGEALIALEAPLNKKASDRIDRFRPVWRDVALFICQIEGVTLDPEKVTPQFDKPETVQPKTQAEIIKLNTDAGMPLDTALARQGWTDAELEAMNKIKDDQASKAQTSLSAALAKANQDLKTQPMPQGMTQPNPINGVPKNGTNPTRNNPV